MKQSVDSKSKSIGQLSVMDSCPFWHFDKAFRTRALAFPVLNGTFDLSIESTCALGGTLCGLLVTDGLYGLKTGLGAAIIISVFLC